MPRGQYTRCRAYFHNGMWFRMCNRKALPTGYCHLHSPTHQQFVHAFPKDVDAPLSGGRVRPRRTSKTILANLALLAQGTRRHVDTPPRIATDASAPRVADDVSPVDSNGNPPVSAKPSRVKFNW